MTSRDDLRALAEKIADELDASGVYYKTIERPLNDDEKLIAVNIIQRALAAAQGTPCPDPTRHQRSTVCASEGTPAPRPACDCSYPRYCNVCTPGGSR